MYVFTYLFTHVMYALKTKQQALFMKFTERLAKPLGRPQAR